MTATTSLRDTVFSLLAEYGGGALARVGQVWAMIRRVLGNVRQLVRPLLKEVVAFFASKLSRGATVVRETTQKAGDALLRMAQRFTGKSRYSDEDPASEPETEPEIEPEPAKDVAETAKNKAALEPCASASSVPEESTSLAREAILAPRASNEANAEVLSTLGPVVGRALIRAFTRRNMPRPLSSNSELGFEPVLRARAASAAQGNASSIARH
ncbi:MAG: hypothetical protein U0441_38955 [Polyangiaceae bacterium]